MWDRVKAAGWLYAEGVVSQSPGLTRQRLPWESVAPTPGTPKEFHHAAIARADIRPHRVLNQGTPAFLEDRSLRDEMHKLLGGICNAHGCPVLRVGGVADHVHILCRLGRTITLAELVKELKRESSLWTKEKSPDMEEFHWQNGYGAFSISPAHVDPLCEYIDNQEEHHTTESFKMNSDAS